jgi:histidine triad (HIT) family protein
MHVASLIDLRGLEEEILIDLIQDLREISASVAKTQGGARVLTNLGCYQDSKHLHFHINHGTPLSS